MYEKHGDEEEKADDEEHEDGEHPEEDEEVVFGGASAKHGVKPKLPGVPLLK